MAKICASQDGIGEVGTLDIGVRKVCTRKVKTPEGATSEILTGEVLRHKERAKRRHYLSIYLSQAKFFKFLKIFRDNSLFDSVLLNTT